jgi:hypothetical protein
MYRLMRGHSISSNDKIDGLNKSLFVSSTSSNQKDHGSHHHPPISTVNQSQALNYQEQSLPLHQRLLCLLLRQGPLRSQLHGLLQDRSLSLRSLDHLHRWLSFSPPYSLNLLCSSKTKSTDLISCAQVDGQDRRTIILERTAPSQQ